jgi:Tol biopolymer transport system component
MVAFLSSEGHEGNRHRQVWIVPLTPDGRPAAPPSKFDLPGVTADLLAGWTQDDKIGILLPTERKIALYTVPSVGGKATQLTPKAAWLPTWAPDGKAIFFNGIHGGDWAAIEMVPAAGGEVKRIPIDPEYEYLQPTYPSGALTISPNAESICFSGFFRRGEGQAGIFTLPVKGGTPKRLSTSQPHDRIPAWSPDGQWIAFIRRERVTKDRSAWNIFLSPVDGGEALKVTDVGDQVEMAAICWSPDGESIAFFGRDNTLRVIAVSGGTSRVLTEKLGTATRWQGISWAPDGTMLAYVSGSSVWKIPREGGDAIKIETGRGARIGKIDWSPDGKSIAFGATKGGEHELWLMEGFLHLVSTE